MLVVLARRLWPGAYITRDIAAQIATRRRRSELTWALALLPRLA
jgi:hypothetical protein